MSSPPAARSRPGWFTRHLPAPVARRWVRVRRSGTPWWTLSAAAWIVAAAIAAATMRTLAEVASPLPLGGQWARVAELAKFDRGHFGIDDLWAQDGENRLVIARLLTFIDFRLFDGRNEFAAFASLLFQAATAGLLVLLFARVFRSTDEARRYLVLAGALVLGTLFATTQFESFQQHLVEVTGFWAFSVLAIFLLTASHGPQSRLGGRPLLTSAALGAAAIAHLCLATGPATWLAMLLLAAWLGAGWRLIAVIMACGLALTGAYFLDYSHPAELSTAPDVLRQPGDFGLNLLALLGNPVAVFGRQAAVAGGACFFGSTGWLILAVPGRRQEISRAMAACGALILLVILTSAWTAATHLDAGTRGAVQERYVTGPAIGWLCLIVTVATLSSPLSNAAGRPVRAFATCFAAALLVAAAWSQFDVPGAYRTRERALALPADAFLTGILDPEALAIVYRRGGEPFVGAQVAYLRRKEYSVFAGSDDGELLGTKLGSFADLTAEGRCQGNFDAAEPVAGFAGGYRVVGWAWDGQRQEPIRRILLADRENVVLGLATTSLLRPDVVDVVGVVSTPRVGWIGYVLPAQSPVRAYGVLERGAVCPLFGELPVG